MHGCVSGWRRLTAGLVVRLAVSDHPVLVHSLLCPCQRLGSTAENIPCYTSVREPIDRLVSLYYYVMDKWRRPVTKLMQDMTPVEALEAVEGLWPLMRQTPLLSHFGTW